MFIPASLRSIVAFLFIMAQASSFAQLSPKQQSQVDSIDRVIQRLSPCHDTVCLEAQLTKAKTYYDAHNLDSAVVICKRMVRLADEVSADERTDKVLMLKSTALNSLGLMHDKQHQYVDAIEFYQKSLTIREEYHDPSGIANNLNSLLSLAQTLNDTQVDLYTQKAFAIHDQIEDSLYLGVNWETIGHYYRSVGYVIDSAVYAYEQAAHIHQAIGATRDYSRAIRQLSNIYKSQGDVETAITYMYESLKMEESTGNIYGVIGTNLSIANLYAHEDQRDKADEILKASLDLCRQHGFVNKEANILLQLGLNAQANDKIDDALSHAQASLALVEEHQLGKNAIGIIYVLLIDTYTEQGYLQLALNYALKGLELNLYHAESAIARLREIGELYFKLERYDEALDYTQRSLELAKQLQYPRKIQVAAIELHRMHQHLGNHEQALYYFKRATAIKDSLNNLEADNTIIEKEAEYKIAKKQRELELEKKTTALLAQKQEARNYLILGLSLALLSGLLVFMIFYQRKKLVELEANRKIMLQVGEIEGLKSQLHHALVEGQGKVNDDVSINDFLTTPLSDREVDVLNELIKGKSNKEISETLCISVNTVTTHLKSIYTKLEVGNRTQAVKKASRLGL